MTVLGRNPFDKENFAFLKKNKEEAPEQAE